MNHLAMQNKVFRDIRGCCQHILQAYDKMSSSFLSAEKRAKFSQKIDAEVQEQIIEKLSQSYKGHKFVAEEPSEIASQNMIEDRDVWIIDPIDGSHNFASYLPSFAISICYVYEGQPQVAWVYDPIHDELFSAIAGYGATLNQRRIRISNTQSIDQSLGGIEFHSNPLLSQFLTQCGDASSRKIGSVALTLCYLAAGRYDWAACQSPRIWDYSAALLIAQEAGAIASDIEFNDQSILLAANPSIHTHFTQ